MHAASPIIVGCAGWAVPAAHRPAFGAGPSLLARYSTRLAGVEINSSFYRPHQRRTYERWAATVPPGFQFALKLPRTITHTAKLRDPAAPLAEFLAASAGLGAARGPILVQLPPSLALDLAVARQFWAELRAQYSGPAVCEPRHPSWFTAAGDALLSEFAVGRVAADPAVVPAAASPGGWPGLRYYRLHGSPTIYYSPYDDAALARLADALRELAAQAPTWCIFDNTALGHAAGNALALLALLAA